MMTLAAQLSIMSSCKDGLPAIGEIKARTETVGPTFALVQALMYSAQIATRNQFLRLRKQYKVFSAVNVDQPRVDVLVLLENSEGLQQEDLQYALSLAKELGNYLSEHVRHILFSWCSTAGDVINCELVKPM